MFFLKRPLNNLQLYFEAFCRIYSAFFSYTQLFLNSESDMLDFEMVSENNHFFAFMKTHSKRLCFPCKTSPLFGQNAKRMMIFHWETQQFLNAESITQFYRKFPIKRTRQIPIKKSFVFLMFLHHFLIKMPKSDDVLQENVVVFERRIRHAGF